MEQESGDTKKATNFFISPQGNDQWSGTLPEPNPTRTDGPLATLAAGQKKVRELRAKGELAWPVYVYLRQGIYYLKEPIVFTPADSGAENRPLLGAGQPDYPVIYAAYQNETVTLSGGRLIQGWQETTVNGQAAWVADIPEVKQGKWSFRQLWVNGQRRYRPRLPEAGEYQVAKVLNSDFDGGWKTMRRGVKRFGYQGNQFQNSWRNLRDVEVHFLILWVCIHAKVEKVEEQEKVVYLDRSTGMRLTKDHTTEGAPYFIENVFEALNKPGQWYLDRAEGKLYYLPLPGETPKNCQVVAPFLQELLRIEGRPGEDGLKVENMIFRGINFVHNEWSVPAEFAGSSQASVGVPAALILKHTRNCRFENCKFEHLGSYGIALEEDCHDIVISRCTISDLGAGGVKIWHGCNRNVVADCEICEGGILYPSAVGVLIGNASGNQVVHNHIHHFYYTGISVGWTWGYQESHAFGNIIEYNHIHHLGQGRLSDMGGVYLLGVQPGTRVRYNLIHDITCRIYGGWALYTDEGSSYILLENNICYRTNRECFHQHYGQENIVRNNIFVFGEQQLLRYTRIEPHTGLIFERNIVVSQGQAMWSGDYGQDKRQIESDWNLYWDVENPEAVLNIGDDNTRRSLKEWQKLGFDQNSLIADPKFANIYKFDFSLLPDSPAFQIDFQPIDVTFIGPRKKG
ncbi:MAG: right-handed parallel beta-helix repeat-containing protein [Candidatus Omnitrophica bacterium]|nr:right-handed parallel beta-helix repeat-containing protein [Candidatus Omnitrophota bacterium]